MIERIQDENVWNFLKKDNKPVMVYGMGDAAEKIIAILQNDSIQVAEIFASDAFVRGHSFLGKKVRKYSEICAAYADFNVVLAFATHIDNVLQHIYEINKTHPVFAPDIPVAGTGLFTRSYIEEHDAEFEQVYQNLADAESQRVYLDILRFKVSGKVNYLYNSFCNKTDIYRHILKLTPNETIVDMGAYDGDTIREFIAYTKGKYNKILALEPDVKNFKKLQRNTDGMQGMYLYNIGAWDKKETLQFDGRSGRNSRIADGGKTVEAQDLDSLAGDEPITLIKMDIEGSEMKALNGAANIIQNCRPKLYVCAYHRNEDLFALPMKIWSLCPDYKIYFRHSVYLPAWESNFYCTCD